jgi:hypothetical protein
MKTPLTEIKDLQATFPERLQKVESSLDEVRKESANLSSAQPHP